MFYYLENVHKAKDCKILKRALLLVLALLPKYCIKYYGKSACLHALVKMIWKFNDL